MRFETRAAALINHVVYRGCMLVRRSVEAVEIEAAVRRPGAEPPSALRRELRRVLILLVIFAALLLARFG